MPAKAGIQNYLKTLDSRLRGNDTKGGFKTFYETINVGRLMFIFQNNPVGHKSNLWMFTKQLNTYDYNPSSIANAGSTGLG